MKFGIFYELQLPRPWTAGRRAQALPERARARSSWPTGSATTTPGRSSTTSSRNTPTRPSPEVLPRRRQPAHQAHPARPRHLQLTTNHPARVAERVAMLDLLSNGRCEFGMGESASITELEPFGVDMENKREIFEEAVRAIMPMFKDGAERAPRQVLRHAAAPRAAQAAAEAAPAAVGRLLAARHARQVRRMGHGRARLPVRLGRRRARLGARLLQRLREAAEEARRLPDQPEHRAGLVLHVRQDRRGGARSAPTATPSSSSRCASTARPPAAGVRAPGTVNMWDEYNKWKRPIRTPRRRRCAAA